MKKYTITFDEKQMEFIKVAMDSQVEVCTDVVRDAYKSHVEDTWDIDKGAEYAHASMDFYMAVAIREILNSAEGYGSMGDTIPGGNDMDKAIRGDVISSKEFATEISDYMDSELMECLLRIARHVYRHGYAPIEAWREALTDEVYGIREEFIKFMQGTFGLVKDDGKPF